MHPERLLTPTLDPPPGGLDGLRERLHSRDRRRRVSAGAATVALVALASTLLPPAPYTGFGSDHPVVRVTDEAGWDTVRILDGSAVELAASTPRTRVFLVAAVAEGQ